MKIERERVRETFREYTDAYDATDEKIKLKIDHTYRVAELCERIAKAEQMEKTEVDLAWLLGMLHDVGRFEQLRRYGTFSDADSIDHAALGADILFGGVLREGEGLIRTYVDDAAEDEVIETAIRVHSAYRIPEQRRAGDLLLSADGCEQVQESKRYLRSRDRRRGAQAGGGAVKAHLWQYAGVSGTLRRG